MRTSALGLTTLLVSLVCVGGCAPGEEESAGDDPALTGGSKGVESPVVYFFEGTAKDEMPKCAGTLIADKIAITAKRCAKEGLSVGRADDEDGKGKRAAVIKVESPSDTSDIALVELEGSIGGRPARITHAPLKDGYSVQGIANINGRSFFHPFRPKQGQASEVDGRMVSETETHGSILPGKGSTICAGDMGAPVCSSTGKDTCGLSGIIVGEPEAGATPDVPKSEKVPADCSGNPWKVAKLGPYVDFLKQRAPAAFAPVDTKTLFIFESQYVPDGLWGYKTAGEVKTCKVDQTTLAPVAVGAETKITALASFMNMQENADADARIGIALKSTPDVVRWLPAKATSNVQGQAFDATFEGAFSADKDGEYLVTFRISANGGETWSACELPAALVLLVGNAISTTTPAPPSFEPPPSPRTTTDPSDGFPTTGSSDDDDKPTLTPATKKKAADSGCSAAPHGSTPAPALPTLGLALGVAALVRRRRKPAA